MLFRASRAETTAPLGEGQARAPLPVPASTLVKVALVGDSQVGKTSLMVRYVEGGFDETQLQTQGAAEPSIEIVTHVASILRLQQVLTSWRRQSPSGVAPRPMTLLSASGTLGVIRIPAQCCRSSATMPP